MQFQDQAYSDALSQLKYEENSAFLFASTQSELNEGDKDHEHLYAWASETKMTQFDPSAMCQALTGNVLFVGDVIGEQHYTALKIELAHTNTQFDSKPMPDTEWYPSHLEPECQCSRPIPMHFRVPAVHLPIFGMGPEGICEHLMHQQKSAPPEVGSLCAHKVRSILLSCTEHIDGF